MDRRRFLHATWPLGLMGMGAVRAHAQVPAPANGQPSGPPLRQFDAHQPLVIERQREGKPRAGQVVVAIQPHSDDIPLFAAGIVLKLIDEGATGYVIRVTNDDMAGPGSYAETVMANWRDSEAVGKALGVTRTFDLNYNNHMMDNIAWAELRQRFIFLFRLLKADIVVTYDPWSAYEENPDHAVTSRCVEAAAWMAGGRKDYPEHFAAGLVPHSVSEKYYFARFQQRVNRIVDIGPWVERKIDVNLENAAQGPAGQSGQRLRARLAAEGRRLPLLGDDDRTANREYIRQFVLDRDRDAGAPHGIAYAEAFHYISTPPDAVQEYLRQHATPR
ncbi:MAG: PIG-L family deacetylase [Acidobacteria bacterium]|nr:PIG-L family deacetylase [Acidobacteriota bacterium]